MKIFKQQQQRTVGIKILRGGGLNAKEGSQKGAQRYGLDYDQLFATKWSQKQTVPNLSSILVIDRPIDRAKKTTH